MVEKIVFMMVTYNRLELTKLTVDDLVKSVKIPYEFVIVDNGSKDGTVEYLKNLSIEGCSAIHLIFNETNRGISIGRNQSLKKAVDLGADWFVTLDNDVRMPEGWLEESIAIIKANPSYGMIGVNMEGIKYPIVNLKGYSFQNKPQGNLGTACIVFPKSLQKMLGYFNTQYGPYGEEDADFGVRARVVGYKLGYIERMGEHLGVGVHDQGEYREFKTSWHNKNFEAFRKNVIAYNSRQKPLYLPYSE